MDTTHDHGQMTTTDPHAGHLTTTDPHAGHLTTTDPHAGHLTTTDPHAGHHTTTDPHAGHYTTTGHDHGGTSSEHSMVMFMHGGYNEYIVFHEWKITSVEALIGTCFGLFFISVGYEALKFARDKITIELRKDRKIQATYNEKQLRIDDGKKPKESYFKRMLSLQHVIQTLFHVVQFFIAYFLMLSVMTYNYWICMSILLGIAAGFFFFGVRRSNIDLNEDCGCH